MSSEEQWKFSQCFGEKADVEDLTDGAYLAAPRPDPC
jgi:hypothetical protein